MKLLRKFSRQNRELKTGLILLSIIFIIAIFAPVISPYDPLEMDIEHKLNPPSMQHIVGTDNRGRDIFSRLLIGSRTTLISSLIVVSINVLISIPLGILAGYLGGIIDASIRRLIEIIMAALSCLAVVWGKLALEIGFGSILHLE